MKELIDYTLKSINVQEYDPDGELILDKWISANEHYTEYVAKRVIGELRHDPKDCLYGVQYTRVVITDYKTKKQIVRKFTFPATEEESERRHVALLGRGDKKAERKRAIRNKIARFVIKAFPPTEKYEQTSSTWEMDCYRGRIDYRCITVFDGDVERACYQQFTNGDLIRFDPIGDGVFDVWYSNGTRYKVKKYLS